MNVDETVKQHEKCRKILLDLNNSGIGSDEKLYLIYLLSLELEDPLACSDLSIVSRSFCEEHGLIVSKS